MRVFNLTDVKTAALEQRSLVDQHIAVAGRMVAPGEYVDVEASDRVKFDLEYLLTVGAVSIDGLPPPYTLARQQREASTGRLAAHIGQRVDVKETKIAGEGVPSALADGATVVLEKSDPTAEPGDESPPPPPETAPPKQDSKKKSGNR